MSNLDLLGLGPSGWGGVLLHGALTTLVIALCAYAIGLALGMIGALAKLSGLRALILIGALYTTLMRAIPELLLIILLYFAGTDLLNRLYAASFGGQININGTAAGIGVLGVVMGAYATEVIRGAILAIPVGQIEAARAYGMGRALTFRRIVLPAMLPAALPGLGNLWMVVIKDTSLVSVVGAAELVTVTKEAAGSTRDYFLFYLTSAAIYLAITLISQQGLRRLEARSRVGQRAR